MTKRRGNGEGSIYKRPDGRWEGRYSIETLQGRKRASVYGRTRKEVASKLIKAIVNASSRTISDMEPLNVREYMERWLSQTVKGSVASRTYSSYAGHTRNHIVPALGHIKLKKLSLAHVQSFYRLKSDSGLKASTVHYIHATLRRALKYAKKCGYVAEVATDGAVLPKLQKTEMQALSPLQAREFLKVAAESGDRFEALYVMAIRTGMRRGELLALRWSDVDFEAGRVRVVRSVHRHRDQATENDKRTTRNVFASPKNGKGRVISLTSATLEALKRHRVRQAEEKLRAGPFYEDNDLIFATEIGTVLEPSNIDRRSFKPLLKKAGLPGIRFHDLRHTCASILISQNINVGIVKNILGHSDVGLTINTYSHVMPEMQEVAGSAMDRALA